MAVTPAIKTIADWVVRFDVAAAPERLRLLTWAQTLSVAACTLSGAATTEGRAVAAAASRMGPPRGAGFVDPADIAGTLDLLTSWSMVQDYDDYLFMGHTGHSAIWVPLVLGAHLRSDPAQVFAAMLIANEIGGRLGASLVFGPHNGQMWAPIHRAAAAAAAARLLGLSSHQTANALGIALYGANDPVFRGFMGPDSKIRTAAESVVGGVRAAMLAAEGLTGAWDLLEHRRGFWRRFSFIPLRGTFRGLGETWVTDTLAVKPFPGCAYVDTPVHATTKLIEAYKARVGEPLAPHRIDHIRVAGGVLTVAMDALSREAAAAGDLSPVVVNFSVPLSVAATLIFGALDGVHVSREHLQAVGEPLREIADRVKVLHDPSYSVQLLRAIDRAIPMESWFSAIGLGELWRVRGRVKHELGNDVERAVLSATLRGRLSPSDGAFLRRRILLAAVRKIFDPLYGHPADEVDFSLVDFRRLKLPFPARVTIVLRNGERLTHECLEPPGTSYGGDILPVAEAKWRREAERFGSVQDARDFAEAARDPKTTPGDLLRRFAGFITML